MRHARRRRLLKVTVVALLKIKDKREDDFAKLAHSNFDAVVLSTFASLVQ